MDTIEDAAIEKYPFKLDGATEALRDAFKAGVYFAQRWIKVEDELPKYNGVDYYILVKNVTIDMDEVFTTLIESIDDIENVFEGSTHWRPINLK